MGFTSRYDTLPLADETTQTTAKREISTELKKLLKEHW